MLRWILAPEDVAFIASPSMARHRSQRTPSRPSRRCSGMTSPRRQWMEALPIGNGRLGAMVFGGVAEERIQFNESTLWTGQPHDYANEGASAFLQPMRDLLNEGRRLWLEAEALDGQGAGRRGRREAQGGQGEAEAGRGHRHARVHERADPPEVLPGVRRPAPQLSRARGRPPGGVADRLRARTRPRPRRDVRAVRRSTACSTSRECFASYPGQGDRLPHLHASCRAR